MIAVHLLGIITGEPVIKVDPSVHKLNRKLTADFNGRFSLLASGKPGLCPATIPCLVVENRSLAGYIKTLDSNLKVRQRVYKPAVIGLLMKFFFCSSPQEGRYMP